MNSRIFFLATVILLGFVLVSIPTLQEASATVNDRKSGLVTLTGSVGIISNWCCPESGLTTGDPFTLYVAWDDPHEHEYIEPTYDYVPDIHPDKDPDPNVGLYRNQASLAGNIGTSVLDTDSCNLRVINDVYEIDEFRIECDGVKINGRTVNDFQIRWVDNTGQILDSERVLPKTILSSTTWHTEINAYGDHYSIITGSIDSISGTGTSTQSSTSSAGTTTTDSAGTTTTDSAGTTTTKYPDGKTVVKYANGNIDTTYPDGKRVIDFAVGHQDIYLPDGTYTRIIDGIKYSTTPEETIITEYLDGTTTYEYPDGTIHTTTPDGVTTMTKDGSVTILSDGSKLKSYPYNEGGEWLEQTLPDGTNILTYPKDDPTHRLITTTYLDGTKITSYDDGTVTTEYPDGSSEYEFPNGLIKKQSADGTETSLYPEDITFDVIIGGTPSVLSPGQVTFSGTGIQGDQINIEIFDSSYERISSETVFVRSDGNWYSPNIDLDGGDYTVLVGVPGREQKSEDFTIPQSIPKSTIPEYQKTVFQWWSEGTVSDSEVMNGVEYLITSGVIQSKNIQILDDVTADTSGIKSETVIPEYQKNVFQWWAQGLVSDSEVMNGVEYLITSGVIQSKNIQILGNPVSFGTSTVSDAPSVAYGIESKSGTGICATAECDAALNEPCGLDVDNECIPTWFGISQAWSDVHGGEVTTTDNKYPCPEGMCKNFNEIVESSYHVQMWNVAIFSEYLELKNFESKILKDASDDMWNEYAENQNQNTMMQATLLEKESRLAIEAVNQALKSLNYAIAVADLAKGVAVSNGVPVLELEEGVQEQQEIIDSVLPELSNYADFKHEVFEIKKLQGKTDEEITELIQDSRDYWKAVNLIDDGAKHSTTNDIFTFYFFGDDSVTDLESILGKSTLLGYQFLDIYLTIDELKDYDAAKNYVGKESVVPELVPIISLGAPDIIKGHNMIKTESDAVSNNRHPLSKVLP